MFVITNYPLWPSFGWLENKIRKLKSKRVLRDFADREEKKNWQLEQELKLAKYQLAHFKMM